MDERVAKLKTSADARQLAENAHQRGNAVVAAQALARARELQAPQISPFGFVTNCKKAKVASGE